MSLYYNGDNSYLFVNGKEIYKFKASNKNFSFPFFLGNISNKLGAIDCKEVSSKGNAYDFSVDCSSIDKSNILNIHKYLMIKNSV